KPKRQPDDSTVHATCRRRRALAALASGRCRAAVRYRPGYKFHPGVVSVRLGRRQLSWRRGRRKLNDRGYTAQRDVAVVESADLRHCHDIAALGLLDRAWLGRVLPESEMRARGVIVAEVIAKAT